jgi:hypothetical protein
MQKQKHSTKYKTRTGLRVERVFFYASNNIFDQGSVLNMRQWLHKSCFKHIHMRPRLASWF